MTYGFEGARKRPGCCISVRPSGAAWLVGAVAGLAVMGTQGSINGDRSGDLSWGSAVAHAQSARADAADALFRQAQDLGRDGKWEQACEKFAASSALEPGVGTLLYLGDCYERLDRFASASQVFAEAAELAGKRGDTERQHVAAVRAAALEPRAPRLEVRASEEALLPGLQVTFNGVPLSSEELNMPRPRDAGLYEVVVSAPGYESFKSRIELRNGSDRAAILTVPPLLEQQIIEENGVRPEAPKKSPPASVFFDQSTVGMLVGGAGIVLAGTAGVLTTFAQSSNEESKDYCSSVNANDCSQRGVELRKEALDMATVATIVGVASGLALASGTYLFITAEGMESGTPEAATLHIAGSFDLF